MTVMNLSEHVLGTLNRRTPGRHVAPVPPVDEDASTVARFAARYKPVAAAEALEIVSDLSPYVGDGGMIRELLALAKDEVDLLKRDVLLDRAIELLREVDMITTGTKPGGAA